MDFSSWKMKQSCTVRETLSNNASNYSIGHNSKGWIKERNVLYHFKFSCFSRTMVKSNPGSCKISKLQNYEVFI